jgi:H3 lysine-79-specific histone-lysine N-methyltransferase
LNKHYEAFSSQTYGETSFDRMQKILDELKPKVRDCRGDWQEKSIQERDVFVDLGSGVGNLVLHVAGGSRVRKAYGIEIAQLPVQYAEAFKVEFVRWMKWSVPGGH